MTPTVQFDSRYSIRIEPGLTRLNRVCRTPRVGISENGEKRRIVRLRPYRSELFCDDVGTNQLRIDREVELSADELRQ